MPLAAPQNNKATVISGEKRGPVAPLRGPKHWGTGIQRASANRKTEKKPYSKKLTNCKESRIPE
jgi:hypothetical protein